MNSEIRKTPRWSVPVVDNEMLKTFVAIAETGSMSKASKLVFRTPAAVSMQVKKLEEMLGCQLFERKARTTSLSSDGDTLLSYARKMLRLNDEMVSVFLKPKLDGFVKIGLPEQFGTHELPIILSQFAKSHPSVQVDVVMGKSVDLLAKFEAKEIDLAVISSSLESHAGGHLQAIRMEKIVWAYLENGGSIEKRPIPLALAEHGCVWRDLALKALDESNVQYRLAYSSENCTGQLAAVKADLAVAAVPESLVASPLKQVPESYGLPPIGYAQTSMLCRSDCTDAVKELATFISNVMSAPLKQMSTRTVRKVLHP